MKTRAGATFAFLLVLTVLCTASCAAEKFVLVEDGVSRAAIVVSKDAPPLTRGAADELALYIEKISGAKPEVIVGQPDRVPEHAIWVGYQPVLKKLFPKVDFEFKHAEEILLAANMNHVVLAGRDRWLPNHLVVKGRNSVIKGVQLEYGTANAVYTFLQDHLGVRWLWPGETGEDILQQKTIALAPFTDRYHPQIRSRSGLFRLSALGDGRGYSHDWVRRQRLQLDSLNLPGGHAYTTWYKRFYKTRPDLFAMQPDGTRSGFPCSGAKRSCASPTRRCGTSGSRPVPTSGSSTAPRTTAGTGASASAKSAAPGTIRTARRRSTPGKALGRNT